MTVWGILITVAVALVSMWVQDAPGGGVELAAATTRKITETILLLGSAGTAVAGRVRAKERVRLI